MATKSTRSRKSGKPAKPYPTFPLYAHSSGRWAKKVSGKTMFFGRWGKKDGDRIVPVEDIAESARLAKIEFDRQWPYVSEGRTPPPASPNGLTVKELVNQYLTAKQQKLDSGAGVPPLGIGELHLDPPLGSARLTFHLGHPHFDPDRFGSNRQRPPLPPEPVVDMHMAAPATGAPQRFPRRLDPYEDLPSMKLHPGITVAANPKGMVQQTRGHADLSNSGLGDANTDEIGMSATFTSAPLFPGRTRKMTST